MIQPVTIIPNPLPELRNLILHQLHIRNLVSLGYTACFYARSLTPEAFLGACACRRERERELGRRRYQPSQGAADIQTCTIMIPDYNYKMRYCSLSSFSSSVSFHIGGGVLKQQREIRVFRGLFERGQVGLTGGKRHFFKEFFRGLSLKLRRSNLLHVACFLWENFEK